MGRENLESGSHEEDIETDSAPARVFDNIDWSWRVTPEEGRKLADDYAKRHRMGTSLLSQSVTRNSQARREFNRT